MTLPWTAEQCEWLRAMGHAVFVRGMAPPPAADSRAVEPVVPLVKPAAHAVPAGPTPSRQAPVERERSTPPLAPAVDEPPAAPVSAPSAGLRTLHRALLRAAGQRTARAAEAVLAELGVDTAAVRGDAAAKRALWVRLRARRRQGTR